MGGGLALILYGLIRLLGGGAARAANVAGQLRDLFYRLLGAALILLGLAAGGLGLVLLAAPGWLPAIARQMIPGLP
jgi:hypothetical protein